MLKRCLVAIDSRLPCLCSFGFSYSFIFLVSYWQQPQMRIITYQSAGISCTLHLAPCTLHLTLCQMAWVHAELVISLIVPVACHVFICVSFCLSPAPTTYSRVIRDVQQELKPTSEKHGWYTSYKLLSTSEYLIIYCKQSPWSHCGPITDITNSFKCVV